MSSNSSVLVLVTLFGFGDGSMHVFVSREGKAQRWGGTEATRGGANMTMVGRGCGGREEMTKKIMLATLFFSSIMILVDIKIFSGLAHGTQKSLDRLYYDIQQ
ncbi:hypothetical protein VNO78_17125 [Psophocarpus tetragonolobus]|uniref:Uncharacterized protein n=1 Tax=Psophocarpus tetragonolobus TaxID=3891 RepID=A0AAN9XKJ2_PSOTE